MRGLMVAMMLLAASARAEDPPLLKDLTAVIALHGHACGEVVSAVRHAESDYVASCKDGTRYRVFTNATGRVIVEKQ